MVKLKTWLDSATEIQEVVGLNLYLFLTTTALLNDSIYIIEGAHSCGGID
jgi:hypothetical protein